MAELNFPKNPEQEIQAASAEHDTNMTSTEDNPQPSGNFVKETAGNGMTPSSFEYGLQFYFNEFYIWYSIIKSVVYAFIISSIAAYFGYNVKGGALEVGKASTNAVVMSSIMILLADVVLTHLMLT